MEISWRTAKAWATLAILIASTSSLPVQAQDNKTELNTVPISGRCISLAAGGLAKANLVNSCAECRSAVISWCDGNIRKFDVQAYKYSTINTCVGTITLVTDVPCGASSSSSSTQGTETAAGASCSATNDVGDTCSVTCKEGETAECSNGTGASKPVCSCK